MKHVALGAAAAIALAVMVVAVLGFRCNLRSFRRARHAAPLEGLDLSGVGVTPVPEPNRWPKVDEVTEPPKAAAYASLAEDRMLTLMLVGELVAVTAGAAIGIYLPLLLAGGLEAWPAVVAVLIALVGIGTRVRAVRYWEPLAARYRARYREMTAVAPPPPPRGGHRLLRALRVLRG